MLCFGAVFLVSYNVFHVGLFLEVALLFLFRVIIISVRIVLCMQHNNMYPNCYNCIVILFVTSIFFHSYYVLTICIPT